MRGTRGVGNCQSVYGNADQDEEKKYWQKEGERMQNMAEEQAPADVSDWEGHHLENASGPWR